MDALVAVGARARTRTDLANNLAMLNLDLTDDDLGRFAAEQSRVLRRRIAGLLEAASLGTAGEPPLPWRILLRSLGHTCLAAGAVEDCIDPCCGCDRGALGTGPGSTRGTYPDT